MLERLRQRQSPELILALDDVPRPSTHFISESSIASGSPHCTTSPLSSASHMAQTERSLQRLLPPRDATRHRRLWLLLGINLAHSSA